MSRHRLYKEERQRDIGAMGRVRGGGEPARDLLQGQRLPRTSVNKSVYQSPTVNRSAQNGRRKNTPAKNGRPEKNGRRH